MRADVDTVKVADAATRAEALSVIESVFAREKRWVKDVDAEIPEGIDSDGKLSWFVARVGGRPAGVIRLHYGVPLEPPAELEVTLERTIDPEVARACRLVEVGRFMILPEHRRGVRVSLALMRAAVGEVVDRGFTHFVTDVYDGDPHSPLLFHTRVLGFERIGTHRFGELSCDCMRIILVLDLARAYRRAKLKRNRIFRELVEGLQDKFERLPTTAPLCVDRAS